MLSTPQKPTSSTEDHLNWQLDYYSAQQGTHWRREDYWRFWGGAAVYSVFLYFAGRTGYVDSYGFSEPPPTHFVLGVLWAVGIYLIYYFVHERRERTARIADMMVKQALERMTEASTKTKSDQA